VTMMNPGILEDGRAIADGICYAPAIDAPPADRPVTPVAENAKPLGARAALAAHAQGRFWAMHDRLFSTRQMKREATLAHANAIGLDEGAFAAALDDPAIAQRVEADRALGSRLGVRSTPTFFVNGRPFAGALEGERLHAIVEEERAAASRLVEAGCERGTIPGKIARAAASP